MTTCISKLVEIASASVCTFDASRQSGGYNERVHEFAQLCEKRNGFYAFESALHVFPIGNCDQMTFCRWNANETWRYAYGGGADELEFFAEDVFGDQFGMSDDGVVLFRSETGETTHVGGTLEDWACSILADYEFLTGYPFAHEWQERFGPLLPGQRLAPKVPFVFGGAYEIGNFYVADAVKAMLFKADIYRQIKDMPDGTRARLTVERP